VWLAGAVLSGAAAGVVVGVLAAAAAGGAGVTGWLVRLLLGVLAGAGLGLLYGSLRVGRRYASWRYRFGPDALELEYGVWWRKSSAVPYQRIQQVEIQHGPIQRRLGLVALSLRTASVSTLGSLPGIAASEAGALRRWLLRRAGADDGA
jgi:membrane protein YdbS with pleckstrin-like domain